ncbi:type VII secretion protein EccB [Streptomyces bambusae]|uniref:type VII secretion protein EccB n=1 Tax=Streptomyces bambusae TaxID=1550616 RepID=UPI001CFFCDD3|nr:type VII secretion protein EccB [Streptomyces bambusae]MCB5169963.1 type VII secretion protein EccB [Streptomyces bambusae]
MASRRDELNAYTTAKRRVVAALLYPTGTDGGHPGADDGAPRPWRAVVPGLVAAALLLAGHGAWGMLRPQAPRGWDEPGARVIVGATSTTRYVVLETGGRPHLHPVLNLASARLLLDPRDSDRIIRVSDTVLDAGSPPRGPVIGIPYAPDRLPTDKDAATPKRWAACQQPTGADPAGPDPTAPDPTAPDSTAPAPSGPDPAAARPAAGPTPRTATFVLAAREAARTDGPHRLTGGQVLFVAGPDRTAYLVDADGTKYRIAGAGRDHRTLLHTLVGAEQQPQPVTAAWLATLPDGAPLSFPALPGPVGAPARVPGLAPADDRIGTVLRTTTGSGPQHHVVLPGTVRRISEFTAWLIVHAPATGRLGMKGRARDTDLQSLPPQTTAFDEGLRWPRRRPVQVNTTSGSGTSGGARTTLCSVLHHTSSRGRTTLGTWAGPRLPVDTTASAAGTYVTPGSGLLYTQTRGTDPHGPLFLLTDTGLRHPVRTGTPPQGPDGGPTAGEAQIRLGYRNVTPVPVPAAWSELVAKGPRLDPAAARRPHTS